MTNGKRTLFSLLVLAIALTVSTTTAAAEFVRRDVALPAQCRAADRVLVGRVLAQGQTDGRHARIQILVEHVLKGPTTRTVTVGTSRGDALSVRLQRDERVLLLLASRTAGKQTAPGDDCCGGEMRSVEGLEFLRGPWSVFRLSETGNLPIRIVRATLSERTGSLRAHLVEAMVRGPSALTLGAPESLLGLAEQGVRFPEEERNQLVRLLDGMGVTESRETLVRLIGRIGGRSALPVLLRTLNGEGAVRSLSGLADALRRIGLGEAGRILDANLTRNRSTRIRRRIARLMGLLGDARFEKVLVDAAVTDGDIRVRAEALQALGAQEAGSRSLNLLRDVFFDPERALIERKAAAVALSERGPAGIEALLALPGGDEDLEQFVARLRRSPSVVRQAVRAALGSA